MKIAKTMSEGVKREDAYDTVNKKQSLYRQQLAESQRQRILLNHARFYLQLVESLRLVMTKDAIVSQYRFIIQAVSWLGSLVALLEEKSQSM